MFLLEARFFASDCSEEFTEGVQQCNEVFPPDNAILMAVNSLCILVEGAGWVVCKIGEML